jgi:hypothetical protein
VGYLRDWNTHTKHQRISHHILNLILRNYPAEKLIAVIAKPVLESLVAYSDRQFAGVNAGLKDAWFVEYTLERMDAVV